MDNNIDLKDKPGTFKIGNKEDRKLCEENKKAFLEENQYAETDSIPFDSEISKDIQYFDPGTHDAWVLHCPKSIDIDTLTNKRIKMPGRRYVGDIQVRATRYALAQTQAIGYVNKKSKYATKILPLVGQMTVGKRLNQHQPSTDENTNKSPKSIGPQKFMAHMRHPYFGRKFKRYIELDKIIQKKLRNADKKYSKACIKALSTENFYQVRNKLMATTQTHNNQC